MKECRRLGKASRRSPNKPAEHFHDLLHGSVIAIQVTPCLARGLLLVPRLDEVPPVRWVADKPRAQHRILALLQQPFCCAAGGPSGVNNEAANSLLRAFFFIEKFTKVYMQIYLTIYIYIYKFKYMHIEICTAIYIDIYTCRHACIIRNPNCAANVPPFFLQTRKQSRVLLQASKRGLGMVGLREITGSRHAASTDGSNIHK